MLAENVITKPGHPDYLGSVMKAYADFRCDEYQHLKIRCLYAEAVSQGGLYLVQKLYFGPLYDLRENCYVLDLKHKNPSRFIRAFQECIQEKEIQLLAEEAEEQEHHI